MVSFPISVSEGSRGQTTESGSQSVTSNQESQNLGAEAYVEALAKKRSQEEMRELINSQQKESVLRAPKETSLDGGSQGPQNPILIETPAQPAPLVEPVGKLKKAFELAMEGNSPKSTPKVERGSAEGTLIEPTQTQPDIAVSAPTPDTAQNNPDIVTTPDTQPNSNQMTPAEARATMLKLQAAGTLDNDTFNHLSALPDEELVQEVTQIQERNLEIKYNNIAKLLAKELKIPESMVDKNTIRKIAEKISKSMDLDNMTQPEIDEKIKALFEEDTEFQDMTLELYRKQLFQKAYEEKHQELEAKNQFSSDEIEDFSKDYANQKVREFDVKLDKEKTKKQRILSSIEEETAGIFGFFVNVIVPEILGQIPGNK